MDRACHYRSIQDLRGIAALLVVLFHLRIVETKYAGDTLLPAAVRFADAGVDLFFVISGFVMASVCAGRFGRPREAALFFARRAWRVLPPYWIYTSLVLLAMAIAPGAVNTSYAEQSVLASYLLWPQAQLPLLTVGWTLIHEMYFYLVMAAALALLPGRHATAFLLAWAVVVVAAQPFLAAAPPWLGTAASALTLEFIAGMLLGMHWQRLPARLLSCSLPLGAMSLLAGMYGLDLFDARAGGDSHEPLRRTLVFGSAAVLVVMGAIALERRGRWPASRLLQAIGDSSYSLYLSHVFVISGAGRLWMAWGAGDAGPLQHAAFLLLSMVASVTVGLASYRWLEQPLMALGRPGRHPAPAAAA